MPAIVLRWALAIALASFLLSGLSVHLAVLPDGIADECEQYDRPNDEYCSGYRIAGIAFARLFGFLDSHGNAVTALATVAVAGFTFTLWRTNRWLWESATRSANAAFTANAILRDEQRPWIDISIPYGTLAVNKGAIVSNWQVRLTNVGKSPAIAAVAGVKLIDIRKSPNLFEAAAKLFESASQWSGNDVSSYNILPGHDVKLGLLGTNHVNDEYEDIRLNDLYIIACVTYRYPGAEVAKKTGAVLHLYPIQRPEDLQLSDRHAWLCYVGTRDAGLRGIVT